MRQLLPAERIGKGLSEMRWGGQGEVGEGWGGDGEATGRGRGGDVGRGEDRRWG